MNLKRLAVLRLLKLLNIILIPFPFVYTWLNFYDESAYVSFINNDTVIFGMVYYFIYYLYARLYDAFLVSIKDVSELVCSQILAILFVNLFVLLILTIDKWELPLLWPMGLCFFIQIVLSVIWSYISTKLYFSFVEPDKCIVIYECDESITNSLYQYDLDRRFEIVEKIQLNECFSDMDALRKYKVVFLDGIHSHERNIILKYCVANNINMYLLPRIGDVIMSGAIPVHMACLPFLRIGRQQPNPENVIIKRIFDLFVSIVALLLLSPVLFCVAIAMKILDNGPIFYKQKRLTKDGKVFDILKFRSMRIDAENDGIARLSNGDDDPRITTIGKVLRKYRLDELPQLINIIKGEMSIVGPRPERPEIAELYTKEIPEFALRLQVKAGLTGYAQVYGKYNTNPYNKLLMDLMYIAKPSLLEDIRIIFATLKVLFILDSTEGISKDKHTAL